MLTWANVADVTPEAVNAIQADLTVRLLMTERSAVMTCKRDDPIDAVVAGNVEQFSVLPVESEHRICGLYRADQWFDKRDVPNRPIGDDFERLREGDLIGIDAGILEFLTDAVEHPTRLVVSGARVAGLVCLSDIQKLPVRAAIFSAVTALEMAMANRIEANWQDDPAGWLDLMNESRRKKHELAVQKARQDDTFVSDILLTQFADKRTIIQKRGLVPGTKKDVGREFRAIERLRNSLAHGNHYGETPEKARDVCRTVGTILRRLGQLA